MTDLTEDFLNGAASRLSDLEGFLNVLKENPTEKKRMGRFIFVF